MQIILNRGLPSGQGPPSRLKFVIWNADLYKTPSAKIWKAKGVQMAVEPSHGILNGDV